MLICFYFHIEYIYIYIYIFVCTQTPFFGRMYRATKRTHTICGYLSKFQLCTVTDSLSFLFTFFTCSIVLVKSIPRRFGSCSILFLQHSGLRRLVEHARVQEELELGLRDLADRSRGVTSVSCMGASVVPNSIWIPMIHGECKKD